MPEVPSFLETLSQDELTRVTRYIRADTLKQLLAAEGSPFPKVIHLLVTRIEHTTGSGIFFKFKSSTLHIGLKTNFSVVKSRLQACEGLRLRGITVTFIKGRQDRYEKFQRMENLTELLACYVASCNTARLVLLRHNIDTIRAIHPSFRSHITDVVGLVSPTSIVAICQANPHLESVCYSAPNIFQIMLRDLRSYQYTFPRIVRLQSSSKDQPQFRTQILVPKRAPGYRSTVSKSYSFHLDWVFRFSFPQLCWHNKIDRKKMVNRIPTRIHSF